MESIFRFIITATLSLFIFGALSMLVPFILARLFKENSYIFKDNKKGRDLSYIIVLLICGFLMSLFFHSFDYFYTTVALIAPMIPMGEAMLNEKGLESWVPLISYMVGWFSFYLIF